MQDNNRDYTVQTTRNGQPVVRPRLYTDRLIAAADLLHVKQWSGTDRLEAAPISLPACGVSLQL